MFGSITYLPRFHNYQDAVYHYNNTKGIRGRENIRPLRTNRRQPDNYRIEMMGDQVRCYLYRTPVLIYTPTQIIINTYNSRSTCDFINNISPYWLSASMQNGVQRIRVRERGWFLGGTSGHIIIPVDASYMPSGVESVRAAKLEAIVLNRTRASEARKTCKEVVALAVTTSKLDGYWEALRQSTETPADDTMRWLKGILEVGNYRVSASKCFHYGFAGNGVGSQEGLIPALKQWLYKREYVNQGCYDYIPAEYGVIPNEYRSV